MALGQAARSGHLGRTDGMRLAQLKKEEHIDDEKHWLKHARNICLMNYSSIQS